MNLQFYHEKLAASSEFKKFKKEHPDSFLIAGFFILDLEGSNATQQLDYFVPKQKKVAAFTLNKEIKMQLLDTAESLKGKTSSPSSLAPNSIIDLDMLKGIVEDEMKNHTVTEKLSKIIAVLQVIENKKIWFLNCLTTSMGIIKMHVEDENKAVLKFEKANLLEFVKQVGKPILKKKGEAPVLPAVIKESKEPVKLEKKEAAKAKKTKKKDAENKGKKDEESGDEDDEESGEASSGPFELNLGGAKQEEKMPEYID